MIAKKIDTNVARQIILLNSQRIKSETVSLIKKFPDEETVLMLDFDNCIIEQDLSSLVTLEFLDRFPIPQIKGRSLSAERLLPCFYCYIGLTKKDLLTRVFRVLKEVTWRESFLILANTLFKHPKIRLIIISSGIRDVIKYALDTVGLGDIYVVASKFEYAKDNTILMPYSVISKQEKGLITKLVSNSKKVSRCITVGHRSSDVELIKNGTTGYRFSLVDNKEAMHTADYVIQDFLPIITACFGTEANAECLKST